MIVLSRLLSSASSAGLSSPAARKSTKGPYTVKYKTNGGKPATIAPLTGVDWSQARLLPKRPTRSGYTFKGWMLTARDGVSVKAKDRIIVNNRHVYSGLAKKDTVMSITLTAQWARNPVATTRKTPTPTPTPTQPTPRPYAPPAGPVDLGPGEPPEVVPPPELPPPEIDEPPDVIEDDSEPTPPAVIEPDPTPGSEGGGLWALWNLILTIATALIAIALIAAYFLRRRKEEEDGKGKDSGQEKKVNKRLLLRVLAVVCAVIAIVLFILTEDMTQTMALVDQWTIWHFVIIVAALILAVFSRKTYKGKEAGYAGA